MTGKRPVAELMFMDFTWVASDQIFNQAAKMRYMSGGRVKVPLVIRTQQGGGRGNGAQHSQSLEAVFTHTPGLKVVLPSHAVRRQGPAQDRAAPGQPGDLHRAQAALQHEGPGAGRGVHDPVRQGRREAAEGQDVTLVSYSRTLLHCAGSR